MMMRGEDDCGLIVRLMAGWKIVLDFHLCCLYGHHHCHCHYYLCFHQGGCWRSRTLGSATFLTKPLSHIFSIRHLNFSGQQRWWWRPPWKRSSTTFFISGTWASYFKQWWVVIFHNQNECAVVSDITITRLGERAPVGGSQKGDVYSFAIILYEIHGRSQKQSSSSGNIAMNWHKHFKHHKANIIIIILISRRYFAKLG